jgi:hypothetical protein
MDPVQVVKEASQLAGSMSPDECVVYVVKPAEGLVGCCLQSHRYIEASLPPYYSIHKGFPLPLLKYQYRPMITIIYKGLLSPLLYIVASIPSYYSTYIGLNKPFCNIQHVYKLFT